MDEIITQRIPGGCYRPEEQVEMALSVIRQAATLLEFAGIDQLEQALAEMRSPLVVMTAAGALSAIGFSLTDLQEDRCGVEAAFFPYDVEDFSEVDLSPLRLLANPECPGSLQLTCVDGTFAKAVAGEEWLPPATAFLACRVVSQSGEGVTSQLCEEDSDEYGNEYESRY